MTATEKKKESGVSFLNHPIMKKKSNIELLESQTEGLQKTTTKILQLITKVEDMLKLEHDGITCSESDKGATGVFVAISKSVREADDDLTYIEKSLKKIINAL